MKTLDLIPAEQIDQRLHEGWQDYLSGIIGAPDFQQLVERCGFVGWSGQSDGTVIIHTRHGV